MLCPPEELKAVFSHGRRTREKDELVPQAFHKVANSIYEDVALATSGHSLNTITLVIKFQLLNFRVHIQTIDGIQGEIFCSTLAPQDQVNTAESNN